MNIKDIVKDKQAHFLFYRDHNLWYNVEVDDGQGIYSPTNFQFPVPLEDIGNATFNAEEKAILLMRYIRKQMNVIKEAKGE